MEKLPSEIYTHIYSFLTGRNFIFDAVADISLIHYYVSKDLAIKEINNSLLCQWRKFVSDSIFSFPYAIYETSSNSIYRQNYRHMYNKVKNVQKLKNTIVVKRHIKYQNDEDTIETQVGVIRWGNRFFLVMSINGEMMMLS